MKLRSAELQTITAIVCLSLLGTNAHAQRKRRAAPAPADWASHVSAEMIRGALNPSETKPGAEVALRLTDDLKANGDVVLKRGTTITGIVRDVKTVDPKGQANSMMEIQWFAPPLQGKISRRVSIA